MSTGSVSKEKEFRHEYRIRITAYYEKEFRKEAAGLGVTIMRLNHNALAYGAKNNLNTINNNLTKSMKRLSSGYKVIKSSDDPAAKAISQTMQAQIKGLERAELNANDGVSLIQTAEGALNEIHSVLQRMRELAVQAANDTYDETDRSAMQDEIEQLKDELDRISDTTDFNGRKLLNGELNKKGYVDEASKDTLKIIEIGGDIEPGEYGISVKNAGKRAGEQPKITIAPLADGYIIKEEEAGTLSINGYDITIGKGMTGKEVLQAVRDATSNIGIDYNMQNGELMTQQYGVKQYIKLDANNEKLADLLGFDSEGEMVNGDDGAADFSVKDGSRVGFSDTATIDTEGNRVTVTDKHGFKMVYEINPDVAPVAETTVTVLSAGPMVFQIGGNEGQTLNINIGKTTADSLGIEHINIFTHGYATEAIELLDEAVDKVSSIRSSLGAYQNRLDYTVTNLETANENLTGALSRIMDTDMAEEITEYTQQNVLSQSALQMLLKSNARPEGLLQLFQR